MPGKVLGHNSKREQQGVDLTTEQPLVLSPQSEGGSVPIVGGGMQKQHQQTHSGALECRGWNGVQMLLQAGKRPGLLLCC